LDAHLHPFAHSFIQSACGVELEARGASTTFTRPALRQSQNFTHTAGKEDAKKNGRALIKAMLTKTLAKWVDG